MREEICWACKGKGHFSSYGKPSSDLKDRKCLECQGKGKKEEHPIAEDDDEGPGLLETLAGVAIEAVAEGVIDSVFGGGSDSSSDSGNFEGGGGSSGGGGSEGEW